MVWLSNWNLKKELRHSFAFVLLLLDRRQLSLFKCSVRRWSFRVRASSRPTYGRIFSREFLETINETSTCETRIASRRVRAEHVEPEKIGDFFIEIQATW